MQSPNFVSSVSLSNCQSIIYIEGVLYRLSIYKGKKNFASLRRRDAGGVVLPGLPVGLSLSGGHSFPLPYGLPRGRRAADRRDEAAHPLHEQHDLLHRLPVPAAARLFILIYRI